MSTKNTPDFSALQPTPDSGVFPGLNEIIADSERITRIAEALLGPLPIEEGILALAESDGMTPTQALLQLTRWARGKMAPFLVVGPAGQVLIDLNTDQAYANRDLLRRVVQTQKTTPTLLGPVDTVEVAIELFSAEDALHKVLEWHRRYAPSEYAASVPWLPQAPTND